MYFFFNLTDSYAPESTTVIKVAKMAKQLFYDGCINQSVLEIKIKATQASHIF